MHLHEFFHIFCQDLNIWKKLIVKNQVFGSCRACAHKKIPKIWEKEFEVMLVQMALLRIFFTLGHFSPSYPAYALYLFGT